MLETAVGAALSHNLKLQCCKYKPACICLDGGALSARVLALSAGKKMNGGCTSAIKMNANEKDCSAFATAVWSS